MGRKSEKNQQRKSMKKEERERLAAAAKVVKKAQDIDNLLTDLPAFQKFSKNDLTIHLECKKIQNVDQDTLKWILKLEKENMEKLYNSCSWGWNDEKKYSEMTEDSVIYLIARKTDGEPVAFAHFRFDLDFGDEVLYCYELQLEPSVRRKGLGKFMLQVLELIAFMNDMRKVILTVLKNNQEAVQFFYSMRYTTDETSPCENVYEEVPYEILSKYNKKLLSKEGTPT